MDKLISAIVGNLRTTPTKLFEFGAQTKLTGFQLSELVEEMLPVARLIGFLHDLTHAPYGHTVEDEIQLVSCKHDEPARQADGFYRVVVQLAGWLGRDAGVQLPSSIESYLGTPEYGSLPDVDCVSDLIADLLGKPAESAIKLAWRLTTDELAELLAQLRAAMTALVHLEVLHSDDLEEQHFPASENYPFQEAIRKGLDRTTYRHLLERYRFEPHRDAYLLDVVGNTVCADLLDYAQRDTHFAGIKLGYDADRIAENFTLVAWDAATYETKGDLVRRKLPEGACDPFSGKCLRTAISLFSHKFRTDVPSELMNLLNVRFYLHERALFHPTKCAAGAMLGTALQLAGWRRPSRDAAPNRDILPEWFRQLGDSAFIDKIHSTARYLRDLLGGANDGVVDEALEARLNSFSEFSEGGLAKRVVELRQGERVEDLREDVSASIRVLERLRARRYYRPVFRALPNARNRPLNAGAGLLADNFKNANVRYTAEREIERDASLPRGSIVIHCPRRRVTSKIASVLLVMPREDGSEEVRKLRDIGGIDSEVFGAHETAIKAVEDMYLSMWRLTVYVAPQYLIEYERIAGIAGAVISKVIAGRPGSPWPNDETLEQELAAKLEREKAYPSGMVVEHPRERWVRVEFTTIDLGRAIQELIDEGKIQVEIPRSSRLPGVYDMDKAPAKDALKRELAKVVEREGTLRSRAWLKGRRSALFEVVRPMLNVRRIPAETARSLDSEFEREISELADEDFESLLQKLEKKVAQSGQFQRGSGRDEAKWRLETVIKGIRETLRQIAPRVGPSDD